jgi:two-component system chemotaxis response regulator CheY
MNKRILIVDDAATVRMYHRKIFQDGGFDADEAVNGLEALEKSLTQRYDLLLVDVNMPKMDGYSFLREFRAQDSQPQVPALMVSTQADRRDAGEAYRAGANYYLVKPVKPVDLMIAARLLMGV